MRVPALALTLSALVLAAGCGAGIGSVVQPGTSKLELRLIAANPADGFKVQAWDGKESMVVEKRVYLNDRDVEEVKLSKLRDGSPSIDLVFDQTAALTLEDVTGKNAGRRMAILVDGKVVIAPTIKERISGGHVTLAGFDAAATKNIFDRIKKK
jgi:preprotein translocase subunit SecD